MFCSNCGSNIPDGSNMCPNCGAPQQPQYNDPFNQPYNYGQNYNQPYQAPAPKKSNTAVIIGIIVAIVAIAAIVVAIILTKKDDDSSDSSGGSTTESYDGRYVSDLGGGATMTLTVSGSYVKLTSEANGITVFSLDGTITFSGSSVHFVWNDSSYADEYGTYDAANHTITAEGYVFYKQ